MKKFLDILWLGIVLAVAVLVGLCVAESAFGQLVSKEQEATWRQFFPTDSNDNALLEVLAEEDLLFYSEASMPACFQFPVNQPPQNTLLSARRRHPGVVPQRDAVGHANAEFPWDSAAGTDGTATKEFRFIALPKRDGKRLPIVYWRDYLSGDSVPSWLWLFPKGTTVGEVLVMPGPDGFEYCYEIRTRTRAKDTWTIEVYRPVPTREQYAQHFGEQFGIPALQPARLRERNPLRSVFNELATVDKLPEADANLIKQALLSKPFQATSTLPWVPGEVDAHAPTTEADFQIVPKGYLGGFVPVTEQSCTRCHETTMRLATEFARNPDQRDWYGRVRGNDGIFSFHPFEPRSIGGGPIRLRQELLDAGLLEAYDERKHPAESYQIAPAYNPYSSRAPRGQIIIGG